MNQALWKKNWRKAVWASRWLRYIPYVRMVGLNGSMVTGTMHAKSDIDLFFVIQEGHIFFARLLTTALVHVLGIRRHGKHVAGKVCLNRYAAHTFLTITPYDEYHAHVFHNLVPLYAAPGIYEQYVAANTWMREHGYPVRRHKPVFTGQVWLQKGLEVMLSPISRWCERYAMNWQKWRARRDVRTQREGSVVVLSAQELRFHLAKD